MYERTRYPLYEGTKVPCDSAMGHRVAKESQCPAAVLNDRSIGLLASVVIQQGVIFGRLKQERIDIGGQTEMGPCYRKK